MKHADSLDVLQERESIQRRSMRITVANAKKEPAKMLLVNYHLHVGSIMTAWMSQSQLMMRMPLTDMLQSIFLQKNVSYLYQIINILIKEGTLMIGVWSGTNGIEYNRNPCRSPEAKELPTRFNRL